MRILDYVNRLLLSLSVRQNNHEFTNVLVVSNTGLGDTILSTPAIITLRRNFPNLKITFMVHKKMFPLFDGFEFVDDFVLYSSGFFPQLGVVAKLRKRKIDTIFLLHSNGPEDIFFSVLSGAKNILKMTDNINHEFKGIFSNEPNLALQHNIEKKLDLIRLFDPKKIYKKMLVPKHFYTKTSFLNKEPNIKYIGIQLGAQDTYKMWPVNNFVNLAESLQKEFSTIKFVMLGSTKYEKSLVNEFQLAFNGPCEIVNLCGKSRVQDLPSVLNKLDLLITNDTGTLHLAVALQKKTVSLFGPTDSRVFGPYQDSDLHKVIQVDGKFVNFLPKKQRGQEGMELISTEVVLKEATEILQDF